MFSNIKTISVMFLLMTIFGSGCISPEAVKTQIGGIETRLGKLEKVAENLDIKFTKMIQAETINYGGGGWIVLGACLIIVIFLGAFGLLIRMLLRKNTLLKLVTCAVAKAPAHVRRAIKAQVDEEVSNGGKFRPTDKMDLSDFARKNGNFAESAGD